MTPDTAVPLAARLLLDAKFEFRRTLENVPPPGRGGPIGRLSSAAWTVGHTTAALDAWVNDYCAGGGRGARDEWCVEFDVGPHNAPVAFADAEAAFARVTERTTRYLEGLDHAALAGRVVTRPGSFLEGLRVAHVLYRGVAHLFAHAGELSVVSSLLRRADLGLPGPLPDSLHAPVDGDAAGGRRPLLVRFVLDAREAFAKVAAAVPVPAQAGAFDRLNSGGWIIAHIAAQEDQYWSVAAQHRDPDPWLTAAQVRFGDPASKPSYVEACAALSGAIDRGTPYLENLRAEDFGTVLRVSPAERGVQTAQDLLVLQGTHLYALAGELATILSLAGAPDPELPAFMRHTIEAAP